MSYCNKGRDGSDVDARYNSGTRTFDCLYCKLHGDEPNVSLTAPGSLREHFEAHRAAGHVVPDYAFACIDGDIVAWTQEETNRESDQQGAVDTQTTE
jgi:hypothetical protein